VQLSLALLSVKQDNEYTHRRPSKGRLCDCVVTGEPCRMSCPHSTVTGIKVDDDGWKA
jgi:hypothetical protein